MASLFRLAEPDGKIFIDGVDIAKLGLHSLRSQISVIPQVCRTDCLYTDFKRLFIWLYIMHVSNKLYLIDIYWFPGNI